MTTSKSCDEKKKKKLTQGKRKIEIKKIEKSSSRYVTFSKRRNGLFKKAAELSIVSGAQVGILVQNIGGNSVYSFGHPNVESVIDRYLTRTRVEETPPPPRFSNDAMRLKQEYDMICKDLQAEEKEKKRIEEEEESKKGDFWWNMDVENLDFEELEKHLTALEELKKKVMVRGDDLMLLEGWSKSSIPFSDSTAAAASSSSNNSVNCGLDKVVAYGDCFFDHHVVDENSSKSIQISDLTAAPPWDSSDDYSLDYLVAYCNPPAAAAAAAASSYGDCSFIDQVVVADDDDGTGCFLDNGTSTTEEEEEEEDDDMDSVLMLWNWDDMVGLGEVIN